VVACEVDLSTDGAAAAPLLRPFATAAAPAPVVRDERGISYGFTLVQMLHLCASSIFIWLLCPATNTENQRSDLSTLWLATT
jgi:hypothetical protein